MTEALYKTGKGVKTDLNNHTISNVEVSIITPAYNEEGAIADQIKEVHSVMEQTDLVYEVIVVNDGSTDGTAKQVEEQNIINYNHVWKICTN